MDCYWSRLSQRLPSLKAFEKPTWASEIHLYVLSNWGCWKSSNQTFVNNRWFVSILYAWTGRTLANSQGTHILGLVPAEAQGPQLGQVCPVLQAPAPGDAAAASLWLITAQCLLPPRPMSFRVSQVSIPRALLKKIHACSIFISESAPGGLS